MSKHAAECEKTGPDELTINAGAELSEAAEAAHAWSRSPSASRMEKTGVRQVGGNPVHGRSQLHGAAAIVRQWGAGAEEHGIETWPW